MHEGRVAPTRSAGMSLKSQCQPALGHCSSWVKAFLGSQCRSGLGCDCRTPSPPLNGPSWVHLAHCSHLEVPPHPRACTHSLSSLHAPGLPHQHLSITAGGEFGHYTAAKVRGAAEMLVDVNLPSFELTRGRGCSMESRGRARRSTLQPGHPQTAPMGPPARTGQQQVRPTMGLQQQDSPPLSQQQRAWPIGLVLVGELGARPPTPPAPPPAPPPPSPPPPSPNEASHLA